MPESVLQEPWPRSSNDEFHKSTPIDWLAASNGEGRILMAARIRSFRLQLGAGHDLFWSALKGRETRKS